MTNAVVVPVRDPLVGLPLMPPPRTGTSAVSAADELIVVELSKYGTPPPLPVVVKPSVPDVVTGEPVTPKSDDAGTPSPTLRTVPLFAADNVRVASCELPESDSPVPTCTLT